MPHRLGDIGHGRVQPAFRPAKQPRAQIHPQMDEGQRGVCNIQPGERGRVGQQRYQQEQQKRHAMGAPNQARFLRA